MLFGGGDAAGNQGLWVTDGTSAGTHEIAVSGATSDGVVPHDLTAFKNEVLFAGYDAASNVGLWVTDGTAAGTHEIQVSGAYSTGVHPQDLTAFKNEVLFNGVNNVPVGSAAATSGLWVTDGTAVNAD